MQYEDVAQHLEAEQREYNNRKVDRLRIVKAEGTMMSELQADPRWERYGRYLEAEKKKAEAAVKHCESKLLDILNPLTPLEEQKFKMWLVNAKAGALAYGKALTIAQDLITLGDKAEEAIAILLDTEIKQA